MKPVRRVPPKFPIVALALLTATSAFAQEVVQPLLGTTDADALADDMRRLGANPRDVNALVDAARLSLRLEDVRAAAALLQRAENVDPRNPRVKAGQGSVLVQSERPGQALRYFAEAEAQGLDVRTFAADRGLAYDLIGEQDRAQRDYARALRDDPNNAEIIRRYALSLGISGQRQRALAMLDPLLRRSDRAAWRSQAFVLAMTGDVSGASRIASTMMPGGATGLSAFFARLPTLPAIDRAFAVHFGEVRATPERLADARLAPPLAPGARTGGVAIASVVASQIPPARYERPSSQLSTPTSAAAVPAPAVMATVPRGSATPTTVLVPRTAPVLAEARETAAGTRVPASPPAVVAAVRPYTPPPAAVVTQPGPPAAAPTAPVSVAPPVRVGAPPLAAPVTTAPVPSVTPEPVASLPVQVVASPSSTPLAATVAVPPRSTRASEDTILARIIAGLSIPAAELGVQGPARAAPAPAAVAVVEPTSPAAPARAEQTPAPDTARAATEKALADRLAAERLASERQAADRLAAAKVAADKKAADRKAVADRKALAEKKAAAEKKAIADKEAADKKKLERANPARIWVQVAGGAYEGDLPKAYAAVKAKAPAVFGSRAGWTTPLRATNRVLAGPFKTDAEARAFVNDLRKEGVSAFTFASDAGQPVKRLGGK